MAQVTNDDKKLIRLLIPEPGIRSYRDIGEILGHKKQTIAYHAKKFNFDPPSKINRKRDVKKVKKDLSKNNEKVTTSFVVELLGCTWEYAKNILEELGAYEKNVPFYNQVSEDELFEEYVVKDQSLEQLSEKFSEKYGECSSQTVNAALKHYDIPLRPQGARRGEIREKWREKVIKQHS